MTHLYFFGLLRAVMERSNNSHIALSTNNCHQYYLFGSNGHMSLS